MHFAFSSEQLMAAEVTTQLLQAHCTPALLRQLLARDAAREDSRWQALSEMGLMGVLIPTDAGGLGLNETDFVLLAEAGGYAALPEPLVEHAGVAAPLLAQVQPGHPLLTAMASGTSTLAIGHPINPFVADADTATALLLVHGDTLHLVRRDQTHITRQPSIDPFRRLYQVDWRVSDCTRLDGAGPSDALLDQALNRGALFAAAQCLGLAQRSVHLAVAYARERQQFGKPIGSYQAIKHLLATAQVKIEFARPVVYAAAAELATHAPHAAMRVSHAKLAACEAAELATRTAIQVHGAMGYSWEADVHFFLKRSLALHAAWGSPAFHRGRIAHHIDGQPLGPDHTFYNGTGHV